MQVSGSSHVCDFSEVQALSISCDTVSSPCTPSGKESDEGKCHLSEDEVGADAFLLSSSGEDESQKPG